MDLAGLGFALLHRFRARHDPRDLDEAVDVLRSAVPAAAPGFERLACRSDLCVALFARYQTRDTRGDLDEAAGIARTVSPADAPAGVLLNFAHLLDERARTAGVLDDLDLAVDLVRRSVAATETPRPPVERPHGYLRLLADGIFDDGAVRREPTLAEVLHLLGAYLRRRFAWTNVLADVDEAIEVARRLVAMTGGEAGHTRALATLSFTLKSRWLEARREPDLDEAVATGRRALAGNPEDPGLAVALSDTLKHRFDHHRAGHDLDEAIELGRRADGDRAPEAFGNLSALLRARFDRDRDPADLDEAIGLGRRAVEAGRDDAFDQPARQYALARALLA
ncbi:hypothetical protein, partial [Amycolatopsis sp. SID8362]|uniref:hypothetical protein n=1 Tax=Amycolatopsis sp. SID8362 TaxID=2690346 RepID=UPI0014299456